MMENRIQEKENFDAKGEVTGILMFFLAVAFALMYYLPADITGMLGKMLRTVGFGLIGVTAYVIPVFFLYASIDFFLEKRNGVTPTRVKSIVLILVCVSSILSLASLNFEHFKFLCSNDSGEGFSAFKALKLLWVSGYDSTVITETDPGSSVFISGGLLGGSISVALCRIANKVISIIAVVVFLLSQIILVYKVSLKKTAKKTVRAITKATNNVYRSVQHKTNPQAGYTRITRPNSPQVLKSKQNNMNANGNRGLSTVPVNLQKIQGADNSLPVDSTGFPDVQDKSNGYGFESDASVIYYGEKSVNIDKNDRDLKATADFNYTTTRVAPQEQLKRKEMPKFLANEEEPAFYDFGTDEPDVVPSEPPFELEDDIDDDFVPDVRPADIGDNRFVESSDVELFENNNDDKNAIPINSLDEDSEGFSRTEGRIIDTDSQAKRPHYSASAVARTTGRKLTYKPAPSKLLAQDSDKGSTHSGEELREKAQKLVEVFKSFRIDATVINITHGPSITRFELTVPTGVKVSTVLKYQEDIQYAMAVVSVRIEAPIPGKSAIGIEIPNDKTTAVKLRSLVESKECRSSAPLCVPLGRDIPGKPIMCDLTKMPHLLIAGSTGSGKSVCINTILTSILCKATPDQVRLILVDPKIVELQMYNGIPHLIMPVVTDPKKASATLRWAVGEMTRRYQMFADCGVRNIEGYNEFAKCNGEETLPWILIIIDELADLMAVAAKEVEQQIGRLAALARAAGMHMIIATQRPSVDVITGTIKSNIASRIAFAVSSGVDSRTILDSYGAEKLLGKGDMLYAPLSASKPIRGQGAFVSDEEVEEVVSYLTQSYGANYDEDIIKTIQNDCTEDNSLNIPGMGTSGAEEGDSLLSQAVETVIEVNYASVSILQRRLGIGYPRAARLIDTMEKKGYIGPYEGSKPRKVLINRTDWLEIQAKGEANE